MARHVPAWIVAAIIAFLLTNVVVSPDGDHRTVPPSAVSAFMAIVPSGSAAGTTRSATASSSVTTTWEAEANADSNGTAEVSARGCRHQALSRWTGGSCPRCLFLSRGPGQRLPCAAGASAFSSPGTRPDSPSRAGAERRGTTGTAPSLPQLQVFRC